MSRRKYSRAAEIYAAARDAGETLTERQLAARANVSVGTAYAAISDYGTRDIEPVYLTGHESPPSPEKPLMYAAKPRYVTVEELRTWPSSVTAETVSRANRVLRYSRNREAPTTLTEGFTEDRLPAGPTPYYGYTL